jgi:NAD-dependent dihydropyrimidine dehydrogenase PreA subunit
MKNKLRKALSKIASWSEAEVVNFLALHLLDHKVRGLRHLVFYPFAKLLSLLLGKHAGTQVIPIKLNLNPQPASLSRWQIMELIKGAKSIKILECYCRNKFKKCDAPTHSCIWLGEPLIIDQQLQGNLTEADLQEVERVLIEAEQAGLIHQTIFFPDPKTVYCICNCCTCCCLSFHFANAGYKVMQPSPFVVSFDAEKCDQCGACLAVCPYGALAKNHQVQFRPEKCFGCGLCQSACLKKALNLVPRN